jgi:hypothetical protein
VKLSKTITVDYKGGHSYTETWACDGEMHCPHCGEQEVWIEQGGGDYYVGVQHVCLACRWVFYLPSYEEVRDEYDLQRIAKLSSGGEA